MEDAKGAVEDTRLSGHELNRKRVFEDMIEEAAMAPFKIGEALKGIKDDRLYRDEYTNFGEYCEIKWGISRPRAYQLIAASDTLKNLKGSSVLPENERQVRPLLEFAGPLQKETWDNCVKESDGKITGDFVKKFVNRILHGDKSADKKEDPQEVDESTEDNDDEDVKAYKEKDIVTAYNDFCKAIKFLKKNNYKIMSKNKTAGLVKHLIDLLKEEQ